jgi:hypothetical protein
MGEEATGPILESLLELSVFEGPKFELTVIQSLICVSSPLEIAYAPTTNPILFTIQSTPSIRKIKSINFLEAFVNMVLLFPQLNFLAKEFYQALHKSLGYAQSRCFPLFNYNPCQTDPPSSHRVYAKNSFYLYES